MSDDFLKDLQTAPTLTFEPFAEEKESLAAQKIPEEMQKPAFDESILTPEELKQVEAFSEQIDLNNSQMILQFGAGAQKKMADFSETALNNVRTKDLGEIGQMLSNVVMELKGFNEEEDKGFFGKFRPRSEEHTSELQSR